MVKFSIQGWTFEEDIYRKRQLCFITNGLGYIRVEFDKYNTPHLRNEDGSVFFRLYDETEKEVIEHIKQLFPNGFHSREEYNLSWLASKLEDLEEIKNFELVTLIPYGGMRVENCYYDAYKATVLVDNTYQEIFIAASSYDGHFYAYRSFIESSDAKKPLSLIRSSNPEVRVTSLNESKRRAILSDYVACSLFAYNLHSGKLKLETIGIRDDSSGYEFGSYLGNYIPTTFKTYNKAS